MYIALAAIFVAMAPLSQLERACRIDNSTPKSIFAIFDALRRPGLRIQVAFRCLAEVCKLISILWARSLSMTSISSPRPSLAVQLQGIRRYQYHHQ
jgi:hypothetical protein